VTDVAFATGVFTLSLDFELIWGTRDYAGTETFRRACEIERAIVIDRLVALFSRFDLSATWCIVGHLFLDRCEVVRGQKHPDVRRMDPPASGVDWFADDPASDERSAPTFYGRDLVRRIRECAVPQEIGSHTFSHVVFDHPRCTRAVAESEIGKCVSIARAESVELRSFAFPRNRVAHLDVLQQQGFKAYRGPEPHWYDASWMPPPGKRIAHLSSFIARTCPPVVLPLRQSGLWNIPGSMILLPMHGVRKYIPGRSRVVRAVKGIRRAVEERKIFHLWFHPTNMAVQLEEMFNVLAGILEYACTLRADGRLVTMTMGEIADYASAVAGIPNE
jgi:peptidoglycan/xylan/chitin deacetylase (PgdA/CDA1 family)